ncbi:hypothetical protein L7F22_031392 [Adiantum nelumboides]|nr:hypothetical protein [Adiantum nelumboides]
MLNLSSPSPRGSAKVMSFFSPLPSTLQSVMWAVAAVFALVSGLLLWKAFTTVLLAPWLISRALKKQGLRCVPYQLSLGKLRFAKFVSSTSSSSLTLRPPHTVAPLVARQYYEWKHLYGDFFCFLGWISCNLAITNLDQVKEILYNKSGHFEKPTLRADAGDLMGKSVTSLKGERWALHRRIVSPAFFFEKLKEMTPAMIACTEAVLDNWESQLQDQVGKEVDVYEDFKMLTADIIAHCAFGSSYEEGRQVFKLQQEQQNVVLQVFQSVYIPGVRHLPTQRNRYAWQLRKRIESIVHDIIIRRGKDYNGKDLLGILMDANKKLTGSDKLSLQEIQGILIGKLKQGMRCYMCVAKNSLLYDSLHSLKVAGMILNEALRLYPPAPYLLREATKKTLLGSICVPARTMFLLPIIDFQYDQACWGDDAQDFNPQRFADGMRSACKTPVAFCPFSMGSRNCLGQNFAMQEARAILAMTLQRFTFTLSPGYVHSPIASFTLRPQHGMQIIFKKVE